MVHHKLTLRCTRSTYRIIEYLSFYNILQHFYILEKPNVKEIFIYTKPNPDPELLKALIFYGDTQYEVVIQYEIDVFSRKKYNLYEYVLHFFSLPQVSFVRKNKPSAPFITAFQNLNELFFTNNMNIKEEIENQLP